MDIRAHLRRAAAFVACALSLAACESTGMSSPEVIAGDSNTVSFATGKFIDPTDEAESYCADFGRKAVYVSRGALSKSGMLDIYLFNCVDAGATAAEPTAGDKAE